MAVHTHLAATTPHSALSEAHSCPWLSGVRAGIVCETDRCFSKPHIPPEQKVHAHTHTRTHTHAHGRRHTGKAFTLCLLQWLRSSGRGSSICTCILSSFNL